MSPRHRLPALPPSPPWPIHGPITHPRTRLQNNIRQPKVFFYDSTVRYDMLLDVQEPKTLHEALNSPQWKLAMDDEYQALMRNNTWHLVDQHPGQNIVDCK